MRQSTLVTKTRREAPKDEVAKNAELLIRAGFIHKEMAGVYAYLPLGLRVLENIKAIVRQEMDAIGGQEMIMTSLQRKELWERTDRWDDAKVDVWFKSTLKSGGDVGFGWSHEEPITEMMTHFVDSYRDLPAYVYQFQTKLRNELRAKSGIMRGREFLMKDLYSYSVSEEAHQAFYDSVIEAYTRVFNRVGLGDRTYLTFASGGAFTEFSHEFQTLSEAGEDTIYVDTEKKLAINEEVMRDDVIEKVGLSRESLTKAASIEVGNIFSFGGAKSEQLGLYFTDEKGDKKPVILGSYGIGITRLMGAVVELLSDEKGMVWPEEISPFRFHLLNLLPEDEAATTLAEKMYDSLQERGMTVLYDDRKVRAGEKFNDADLMGITYRINVGKESAATGLVELVHRKDGTMKKVSLEELLAT